MITRKTSWLVLSAAAFLSIVILFDGTASSAAPDKKGGRGPTAPTNLTFIARTETTISMSWGASTVNSGLFSYRVRLTNLDNSAYNTLATVSQSQTTYTARFLAPNNTYSIAVYAVDSRGNRSADSNTIIVDTLADTTPPETPTLAAVVLGPSQVRLSWNVTTDNLPLNCCSYSFVMNDMPLTAHINWAAAPAGFAAVVIRHLAPATTNSFKLNVIDFYGNMTTTNSVATTTESSSDTVPPTAPTNLHLVQATGCEEFWLGWTESTDDVDAQPFIEYEIYVNDILSSLPVSAGVSTDFVYGRGSGLNVFYVKAVDRTGNTSIASEPISVTCP
jgi:hypothetical protein